jgi:hypothetical protein
MSGWISVKERLPEVDVSVLAYDSASDYMTLAHRFCYAESVRAAGGLAFKDETDDYDYPTKFDPTHWMPLPDPPQEEPE